MRDTKNPANGRDTSLRPMIAGYSLLENASRLPFGSLTATALTHSPARSWTLDTGEEKYRKSLPDWAASLAVPAIRQGGVSRWPDFWCPSLAGLQVSPEAIRRHRPG